MANELYYSSFCIALALDLSFGGGMTLKIKEKNMVSWKLQHSLDRPTMRVLFYNRSKELVASGLWRQVVGDISIHGGSIVYEWVGDLRRLFKYEKCPW